MSLPVLTPEQRRESLAKAAQARQERATALAAVRNGSVTFEQVLADEDSPLQKAFVRQVLLAIPGVGPATVKGIFDGVGIPAKRRIAGLGSRQREQITARLS